MIICRIKNEAGPGNQMFMYAFAYALARESNQKILILSEISGFSVRQNILQYLNIDQSLRIGFLRLDWIRNHGIYNVFSFVINCLFRIPVFHRIMQPANESRRVFSVGNIDRRKIYVTDGYWECHAYFDKYRNELIKQYTPRYDIPDEVTAMISEVESCESVALHIRKGDFLQFGRLIDDSYYEDAIEKMRQKLKNPVFYLVTEDDEVKRKYSGLSDFHIVKFDTPHKYLDEWNVLKHCHHHIIANSTYSWWTSYLSDYDNKELIIPDLKDYMNAEPESTEEMYLNYFNVSSGRA